jgi:predicted alpha/beta superfamily hydrolase
MKKLLLLPVLLFLVNLTFSQEDKPITIGITHQIQSAEIGETRKINIYLPEDYNKNDTVTYPVIYVLDGGVEEDFIHITGLVRYNTQPWIARFPRSIVVGIENTDRKRDFTFAVPNLDFVEKTGLKKEQFPSYGGSAKYISFLEKEHQPYISKTYKTRNTKTVIGESLGGLLATEILLKHRSLFTSYIIISPSLWWGNESLLKEALALLNKNTSQKTQVYVGAANKDEDKKMYEEATTLGVRLKISGGPNLSVYTDYLAQELHSTIIHQAVYNAFKLFYPKTAYQK